MWFLILCIITAHGHKGVMVMEGTQHAPLAFYNVQQCENAMAIIAPKLPQLRPKPKTIIPACIYIPESRRS